MKFGKKFIRTICLLTCFIFVTLLSCQSVGAIYNADLNGNVTEYKVSKENDELTMTVEYQYGIRDLTVNICSADIDATLCNENNSSKILTSIKFDYSTTNSSDEIKTYFVNSRTTGEISGSMKSFTQYSYDTNTYLITASATFCLSRSSDGNSCNTWGEQQRILAEKFDFEKSFTSSAEINTTIGKVLNIINNVIIPILWVALGVLLIVRGILLGMAIIKSADEPEVRSRKVGGLIWLIIGVFAGYIITITASYVMSMFGYGGYF